MIGKSPLFYVEREGHSSMRSCIDVTFHRSAMLGVKKIVIFTGTGEGAVYALQEWLPRPEHLDVRVVAVTPPVGRRYRLDPRDSASPMVAAGIAPNVRNFLADAGLPVVSAHLPFKPIGGSRSPRAGLTEVGEALSILGGGFALCVQAVLVACDAGEVLVGERVIAASADTSIVAIASRTETFLSKTEGLIVEELLCRPAIYDISKAGHVYVESMKDLRRGTDDERGCPIDESDRPLGSGESSG